MLCSSFCQYSPGTALGWWGCLQYPWLTAAGSAHSEVGLETAARLEQVYYYTCVKQMKHKSCERAGTKLDLFRFLEVLSLACRSPTNYWCIFLVLKELSQTQLRDKGFLPWYFNKDPYWCSSLPRWDVSQRTQKINHIFNLQALQFSISNKDALMGGLDEQHYISSFEQFLPGWAKF